MGQVMKATQGQANRQEVLKRTLSAGTHAPAGVVAFDIGAARYEIPTMRERRATESRFVTSRLGVKGQTVVPKECVRRWASGQAIRSATRSRTAA